MKYQLTILLLISSFFFMAGTLATDTLATKCNDDFAKVAPCMSYGTGQAKIPSKDCCGAVEEIKTKEPVCLCYFMEQALNGSAEIKSMGIHSDRLLLLPSACKLTNASLSDCPKLLKIPANSPEYKMFTNTVPPSSSPATTTGSGASLPLTSPTKSNGPKFGPRISGPIKLLVVIFLYVSWA